MSELLNRKIIAHLYHKFFNWNTLTTVNGFITGWFLRISYNIVEAVRMLMNPIPIDSKRPHINIK